MLKNEFKVLGVMSGTSLDGIDIIECDFKFNEGWKYKIKSATTVPYTKEWINRLRSCSELSKELLVALDHEYTKFLADRISAFIDAHVVEPIDYVCSHGHTAQHQPELDHTYQIGNLAEIADYLDLSVVCDFRKQDVKLGGQGAPLVPIGDHLLFSDFDYCLNLGGFSNVSFIEHGERMAFDVCPVNTVLNHYALKLGQPFDKNGAIAKTGSIDYDLLEHLNALNYYKAPWPKSLGMEWVNTNVISCIESFHLDIKDVLRTMTEHVAYQIGKIGSKSSKVLTTGGGTYNSFLLERIRRHSKAEFVIPDSKLIEFKEALIFGFLGILKVRGDVNCLKSVTGARKDHSSGCIYHPKIAFT